VPALETTGNDEKRGAGEAPLSGGLSEKGYNLWLDPVKEIE
jgi:hypothetical protein